MPAKSPDQLVKRVQAFLEADDIHSALRAVEHVDRDFPDNPFCHHAAGLVFERAYLEAQARNPGPGMAPLDRAEHHYSRALELAVPEQRLELVERAFATTFTFGKMHDDLDRLERALELCDELATRAEPDRRPHFARTRGVVACAIASITGEEIDWLDAERLLLAAPEPEKGDDRAWFHHYYCGLALREVAKRDADQDRLARAAKHLRRATEMNIANRIVDYLLCDCLVQLDNPGKRDLLDLRTLVPSLAHERPGDPLVVSLDKRWKLRLKLLGEG